MSSGHHASVPGRRTITGHRRPAVAGVTWRIAHDVGLAGWFGGAAMGAVGLNAATREVDEPTQRLRVANAGWFRWAPLTALAVGAHLAGLLGRARVTHTPALVGRGSVLGLLRTIATGVALVATVESGRSGRQVIAGGDVPTATAVQPISQTPPEVAAAMRRLRVVQWVMPASTASIWVINALQGDPDIR